MARVKLARALHFGGSRLAAASEEPLNTRRRLTMSNVANPSRPQNEKAPQEKAEDTAATLGNAASDLASQAGNYASEMGQNVASSVRQGAEQAAGYVSHRAEDARVAVGSSFKSFGESIRAAAPAEDNMIHSAACSVADSLENTGKYLEEKGFDGMAQDMTEAIKRNPIPAVFIAAGIGFLLARACTSSRS
jgi:ElaB/YqjD/DUF883 family membrane-anchored ribosome-binding protein